MGAVSILMALKPSDKMKSFYMQITSMDSEVDGILFNLRVVFPSENIDVNKR